MKVRNDAVTVNGSRCHHHWETGKRQKKGDERSQETCLDAESEKLRSTVSDFKKKQAKRFFAV